LVAHIEGETPTEEFENRVLQRTFELNRDNVTEEWKRLHNKKL
jgi:hypothetical protein